MVITKGFKLHKCIGRMLKTISAIITHMSPVEDPSLDQCCMMLWSILP